jgi:N-acetylmannosamine-6-phosphate 2-epimerase / N-acetylmannosamine kinase
MPVLAIDLGGTKTLAALVDGADIVARREVATDRNTGPAA